MQIYINGDDVLARNLDLTVLRKCKAYPRSACIEHEITIMIYTGEKRGFAIANGTTLMSRVLSLGETG